MVDPSTVPADYDHTACTHAMLGCYTMAFSTLSLGPIDANKIAQLERSDVEKGQEMLGLIMFRNIPKSDTAEALGQLKAGSVRPVMITGDNALTAVHIARECGMFRNINSVALLADVTNDGNIVSTRL